MKSQKKSAKPLRKGVSQGKVKALSLTLNHNETLVRVA